MKKLMAGGVMLVCIESLKRVSEIINLAWARVLTFQVCISVARAFWVAVVFGGFQSDLMASQEMNCGGRKISMICEEGYGLMNASCGRPLLFFDNRNYAPIRRAADSGRHVDKVVRRAECLAGGGGQSAVLIHFSNGPLDCGPCVILDLYSLDGKRITKFGRGLDAAISSRRLELPGKVFVELK